MQKHLNISIHLCDRCSLLYCCESDVIVSESTIYVRYKWNQNQVSVSLFDANIQYSLISNGMDLWYGCMENLENMENTVRIYR